MVRLISAERAWCCRYLSSNGQKNGQKKGHYFLHFSARLVATDHIHAGVALRAELRYCVQAHRQPRPEKRLSISSHRTQLHLSESAAKAAVDAKSKRHVVARVLALKIQNIRIFEFALIAVTWTYHIATLSPALMVLPRTHVFKRRSAHVGQGVCQRKISATVLGMRSRLALTSLVGNKLNIDRARHQFLRCIIATDDQQQEITEISRIHVLGAFTVGKHRNQIVPLSTRCKGP